MESKPNRKVAKAQWRRLRHENGTTHGKGKDQAELMELRRLAEAAGWPSLRFAVTTAAAFTVQKAALVGSYSETEKRLWVEHVSIGSGEQAWDRWLAAPETPEILTRADDFGAVGHWRSSARRKAATVLKGPDFWGPGQDGTVPNDLAGLDLRGLDLSGIQSNLVLNEFGAWFCGGPGTGLHFNEAICEGVNFAGAFLYGADFTSAKLAESKLSSTHSVGASFARADLTGADLSQAEIRNATFQGANLTRANFRGADLRGSKFADADLTEADFTGARSSPR